MTSWADRSRADGALELDEMPPIGPFAGEIERIPTLCDRACPESSAGTPEGKMSVAFQSVNLSAGRTLD